MEVLLQKYSNKFPDKEFMVLRVHQQNSITFGKYKIFYYNKTIPVFLLHSRDTAPCKA